MDKTQAVAVLDLMGWEEPGEQYKVPLQLGYTRDLNEHDLVALETAGPLGVGTAAISKLREVHHHLARLLAEGRRPVECSAILGYSQSRISILRRDPAFAELVDYYKGNVAIAYQGVHEKLAQVGTMAVEELRDKLEDGELTAGQLIEVAKFTLDRSVAPPKGASGGLPGGSGAPPSVTIKFVTPSNTTPELQISQDSGLGPMTIDMDQVPGKESDT